MAKLVKWSLVLAFFVILLGAYTRLTDAGLGCPDWPGCYGHLFVPMEQMDVDVANKSFPERPVEIEKAWNEMIHRYVAGTLGLMILAIWAFAFIQKRPLRIKLVASLLLALVVFQAALGMWTVTMNLMPVVVMGHLLGGFAVFCCLYWLHLTLSIKAPESPKSYISARFLARVAVVVLVAQVALGGWTSTNYASLACTELPVCEPGWSERLDIEGAMSVPTADNYEFGVHGYEARMTMHVIHRFGAVVTTLVLILLAAVVLRNVPSVSMRVTSVILSLLLIAQVLLGIGNVVLSLPLIIAVAHNGVAALLLLSLVRLNFELNDAKAGVMHG